MMDKHAHSRLLKKVLDFLKAYDEINQRMKEQEIQVQREQV